MPRTRYRSFEREYLLAERQMAKQKPAYGHRPWLGRETGHNPKYSSARN